MHTEIPRFSTPENKSTLAKKVHNKVNPLGIATFFTRRSATHLKHSSYVLSPLLNVWMADDGNFIARIEDALKIYNYVTTKGPSLGLHMQQEKTKSVVAKHVLSSAETFRLQGALG